jgi:putative peptidoglycan lipid II flippase
MTGRPGPEPITERLEPIPGVAPLSGTPQHHPLRRPHPPPRPAPPPPAPPPPAPPSGRFGDPRPPGPGPRPDDQVTEQLPAVTVPILGGPAADSRAAPARPAGDDDSAGSLARTSGSMAIATLVSRLTGFVVKLLLAYVVGIGVVNDSFTVANTLPNIVYELLLGGVLTSVVVPVLVRARREDADGGLAHTQRMLTMAGIALLIGTVVAVLAAPLLTRLYVDGSTGRAAPGLATAFAYLLLPEIIFYGLGALFSAILNTRGVFGPPAWAPVWNNVVVIASMGVYVLVPGRLTIDPVRMTEPKLLVLGIGTTLGIVVQALVMVPTLRRSGFHFRWRFGWDARLSVFSGLALWVVGYALVSQVGLVITTRVASAASQGSVATYSYAWLLIQMPYGILGVSLLTAILPRMSRAAADGDTDAVIDDLSLGSRLSTVAMLPLAALLTVLGQPLAVAVFSVGSSSVADGQRLGATLAASAFGLLPYAVVMLQLRVFYAMQDARTPTLINVIVVAVKVPLSLACPMLLTPDRVVLGLAAANGLSFVVGAVVGEIWLRARLGRLRTRLVLATGLRVLTASVLAAAVVAGLDALLTSVVSGPRAQAWIQLVIGGLVGLVLAAVFMAVLRTRELRPVTARLSGLLRRGTS